MRLIGEIDRVAKEKRCEFRKRGSCGGQDRSYKNDGHSFLSRFTAVAITRRRIEARVFAISAARSLSFSVQNFRLRAPPIAVLANGKQTTRRIRKRGKKGPTERRPRRRGRASKSDTQMGSSQRVDAFGRDTFVCRKLRERARLVYSARYV